MARSTHTSRTSSSKKRRRLPLAIGGTLAAIFAIGLGTADTGLQGQVFTPPPTNVRSAASDQSSYLNRPTGMNNLYIGPGTANVEIQFKNTGTSTWDQTVSMFYASNFGAAKLDLPVIAIGNRQLTYTRDLGSVTPIDKVTPGGTVSFGLTLKAPMDPSAAGCVAVPTRPAQVKGLGTYDQWNPKTMLCMFYPQLRKNGVAFGELGTYAMYVLPSVTTVKPVTPVTSVATPQAPLPVCPMISCAPAPFGCAYETNSQKFDQSGCQTSCGTFVCMNPKCGNGIQEGEEQCDDGNTIGGDGCSAICQREASVTPQPVPPAPTVPACGNRILDAGEQCEDGNVRSHDGCSDLCKAERCGDGTVHQLAGEQCDDGNNQSGDGCNHACKNESCGDNVINMRRGEQCDDGNAADGDGCSAQCQTEMAKADLGTVRITKMTIKAGYEGVGPNVPYVYKEFIGYQITVNNAGPQPSKGTMLRLRVDKALRYDPTFDPVACENNDGIVGCPAGQPRIGYQCRQSEAGIIDCSIDSVAVGGTPIVLAFLAERSPTLQQRCTADGRFTLEAPTFVSLTSTGTQDTNGGNNVLEIANPLSPEQMPSCFNRKIDATIPAQLQRETDTAASIAVTCGSSRCNGRWPVFIRLTGMTNIDISTGPSSCKRSLQNTDMMECELETPEGTQIIEAGQTKTYALQLKPTAQFVCNQTRVIGVSIDPPADLIAEDDKVSKSITVTCPVTQKNDVGIVMTMPPTVNKAAIAPVTTKLTNAGPNAATNVTIQLQPMGGATIDVASTDARCNATTKVCTIPSIAAGETIELKIGLSSSTLACESWTWISGNISSANDTNTGNNSGFGYSRVTCAPAPSRANLYITKSTTPVRNRQVLAGTVGEWVQLLTFRAEGQPVTVTSIRLRGDGAGVGSIDGLELYKAGATTPFATATIAACGNAGIGVNGLFCATLDQNQLIIEAGLQTEVSVRPRMKTDTAGAVSGGAFTISLPGGLTGTDATSAVRATGLTANDGDAILEGEVFIGTGVASPNMDISGNLNLVTLSKFASIMNANPDANGTTVPTGVASIGQFKFSTVPNVNSKNGLNKSKLEKMMLSVQSSNVLWDGAGFRFYNKANPSVMIKGVAVNANGFPITGAATGNFHVVVDQIEQGAVNATIGAGETQTFVLQANIINPKISPALTSTAQIVLTGHSTQAFGAFGVTGSHILWSDVDAGGSKQFLWIEDPETVIKSTSYQY